MDNPLVFLQHDHTNLGEHNNVSKQFLFSECWLTIKIYLYLDQILLSFKLPIYGELIYLRNLITQLIPNLKKIIICTFLIEGIVLKI